MNNEPQNATHILSRHICGFHQYLLTSPMRPSCVSPNLCQMLGFSEDELFSETEDRYAQRIVPSDQQNYDDFLHALSRKEKTLSLEYRIAKKDGTVIFVSDTMTSYLHDGVMVGDSVLTDITHLKNENQNLRFLSETMPCGFLKYTCEKTPRLTYINDQMLQFLGFSKEETGQFDNLELYRQNIYLMIPPEDRRRFSLYLERVYKHGAPIAGEMTVLRNDGTKAYLFGWVTKSVNDHGEEEFQSACMDITQRHNIKKERETRRYLNALTDVYDKIFEYDLTARTVKCLHGHNSPMFHWIENVPMQMEEATDKWVTATVCEDDRERVLSFFQDFFSKKLAEPDSRPPQIQYSALSSDGKLKRYCGMFLKIDTAVSLFCCRNIPEHPSKELQSKYDALNNMQQLVMRFTEGVVAFEIENDMVKPLYTSENVCSFFGYTPEQWLALAEKPQSIREFISKSGIAYEDVRKLFATGEAEFTYFDMTQNAYRRIKAICSQKNTDGIVKTYVMLYNVGTKAEPKPEPAVRIRTFGYFDVFVNDKPIAFRNEKSKELLALLVDRQGGFVSSEEAISFLWEDEPASSVTLARYRKVALRLKNMLEEYGISDVVESVNGKRRIATDKVRCDLYDYLSGQEEYTQLFKGSYLTNYSWGETTLAELTGDHFYGTGE